MRLHATLFAALLATSSISFAQANTAQDLPPPPPPPLVDAPQTSTAAPSPPQSGTKAKSEEGSRPSLVAGPSAARAPGLNRITVGPLTAFTLMASGEYERAVSDKLSVFVGPRVGVLTGLSLGVSAGARFFPAAASQAPAGAWLGPEIWAEVGSNSGSVAGQGSYSVKRATGMLLAMAGYTWIWSSGFTMSVGGGLGGGVIDQQGTAPTLVSDSSGGLTLRIQEVSGPRLAPTLGFQWNVGYAF